MKKKKKLEIYFILSDFYQDSDFEHLFCVKIIKFC